MYIVLVDLRILNTYHVPTYKQKITLFPVSKHSIIRGMLCLRTEYDPLEFSKKCNLTSTYDKTL